jgi:hypothetical protein
MSRCAVTGQKIALDELRYWSVARQEPYATAQAAVEAERRGSSSSPARAFSAAT